MPPQTISVARIIAAPAGKVWGEMRDWVAHMKHFGLPDGSVTSETDPTKAPCTRIMPGGVQETKTEHSDEEMRYALTVTPHPAVPFTCMEEYKAWVQVTELGAGGDKCLAQYKGSFSGLQANVKWSPTEQCGMLQKAYEGFFGSVAKLLEAAPTAAAGGGPGVGAGGGGGRLAGKVCVVTGGASGLGAAISETFCREGGTVVIADMDEALGAKVREKLGKAAAFHKLDVTQPRAVDACLAAVAKDYGRVDVVVNNAGIGGSRVETAEHPDAVWDQVRSVNLDGAFYVLRAALKQMKDQSPSGGAILNTSSTSGLAGFPGVPAYTAAKSALVGLTRSTAVEYAPAKIRVNAIAPTVVRTPLAAKLMASGPVAGSAPDRAVVPDRNMNPIPGMPQPKDVANVALFLCSDDSKWITGHCIPVDGGYLAGNTGDLMRGAKL